MSAEIELVESEVDVAPADDWNEHVAPGVAIEPVAMDEKWSRPLDAIFANNALGNGIEWDTAEPRLQTSVTISFMASCTFDMTIFGKAVV